MTYSDRLPARPRPPSLPSPCKQGEEVLDSPAPAPTRKITLLSPSPSERGRVGRG